MHDGDAGRLQHAACLVRRLFWFLVGLPFSVFLYLRRWRASIVCQKHARGFLARSRQSAVDPAPKQAAVNGAPVTISGRRSSRLSRSYPSPRCLDFSGGSSALPKQRGVVEAGDEAGSAPRTSRLSLRVTLLLLAIALAIGASIGQTERFATPSHSPLPPPPGTAPTLFLPRPPPPEPHSSQPTLQRPKKEPLRWMRKALGGRV